MDEIWSNIILSSQPPRVVTLIGGGGKTSLMYYLLNRFKAGGIAAIATATTKLSNQFSRENSFITIKNIIEGYQAVEQGGGLRGHTTLVYGEDCNFQGKLLGIPSVWIDELAAKYRDTVFVVEGDGAAGKPLKGYLPHEPVIPATSRLVIAVIGIDSVGLELNAASVHRPERVCEMTGAKQYSLVTVEMVVRLLFHAQGYLQHCPQESVIIPFINKVESVEQQKQAEKLAAQILACKHPQISRVIFGSVFKGEFRSISKE